MTVTEKAWDEIIRQDAGRERWVQFFVKSGGCNGFQYYMGWMDPMLAISNDNHLLQPFHTQKKAWIYIDRKSWDFVKEMMLDFDPFKGFVFENPKAISSCGCGRSAEF